MNNQDNIVDYKEIGQRIRKLRRDKNITQDQLAEMAGVSCSFIGHIERGEKILSLETLARLSKAFDADMHYLMFGCYNASRANSEFLNEFMALLKRHDLI
jgi:transcriptional regulator with XRE-family HTH domain